MTYFHHAIVDSPRVSRDVDSESAQSVIITVLAELWPPDPPLLVPSKALVDILTSVGVSETATRGALSRMQRKGSLDLMKHGRRTHYTISSEVAASIPASQLLTMSFGEEGREWSGDWTVVVFSIPETERSRRQLLRERLRWLGFGPVRDGVWVSPRCEVGIAVSALSDVLPENGLILRSQTMAGTVDVESAWPLQQIHEAYNRFVEDFRPYMFTLRAGELSQTDALRLWCSVLGRWRGFPTIDPDLPRLAMPPDWPQAEARRTFIAVHDGCAPLVQSLVASIVERHDPELAAKVRVLSVSQSLELYRSTSRPPGPDDVLRVISEERSPSAYVGAHH